MGFLDKFKRKEPEPPAPLPVVAFKGFLLLQQHPVLCVVCTTLRESEFKTDEESAGSLTTKWVLDNRDILVGSIMGLKEPQEIRKLVSSWDAVGFSTQVLCGITAEELQSKALEERARIYLQMAGRVSTDHVAIRLGMPDVYKKTPLLVFYWFF